MAEKGTITGSTNNEFIVPTITWSAKQSAAGNYSDVTATLTYSRTNTGYTTSGSWTGSITINGTKTSGTKYISITYNSDTVAIKATTRVKHGADGTKSITISATGGIPGTSFSSTSISHSVTLTPISVGSTMAFSKFTMGEAGEITISAEKSSYRHDVSYSFSGASGVIASNVPAGTVTWTPATALAARVTDATSGTATLTITTKSGDTTVGTRTYSATVYVPSSMKPAASVTAELVNDNATVQGWGVALQGVSKIRYAVTASGVQGSTISAYSVSVGSKTYTAASKTSSALDITGDVVVSAKVTDSRGRHRTVKATAITFLKYAAPQITAASAVRCNSSGTESADGRYIKVTCAAAFSSVGGRNELTRRVRWRRSGGTWSAYTTLSGSTYDIVNAGLVESSNYEVEVSAIDSVGKKGSIVKTLATAAVAFNLREGGRGAAFGKYADADGLEVDWNADFNGDVNIDGGLTVGGKPVGTYESVTITSVDERVTVYNSNVRYFRFMNLCFCRITLLTTGALPAGAVYTVANIGAHAPTTYYALSAYGTKNFSASTTTDGKIRVRTYEDIPTNYYLYISGYWFAS